MTVILNTWIFEALVKQGTSQTALMQRVADLGADGIEVRREYFRINDQTRQTIPLTDGQLKENVLDR
ncbi:hypothetical protein RA16_11960 [Levilactobacillus brevis]|nr:hypothetical protein RA16_11960 [Levilactobacillus brevis]